VTAESKPVPIITIDGLVKASTAPPLRLNRLSVPRGERLVLAGLDAGAAEVLVHLVTGAALPDHGTIQIDGRDTRDISTDAEWLTALDQFGLVSDRAVLLDGLTIEANLALPLTLSIDPIADTVRAEVRRLAADVGLAPGRLGDRAVTMSPDERVRVHLARALAPGPRLLLLEHPTRGLGVAEAARAFGEVLCAAAGVRGVGWLAISNDGTFAQASGGRRLRLDPSTGAVRPERSSWLGRLFSRADG
jgi:predicted ABC-type transport system involved in lysophospholipase L1 biosynthesis ATPase subunit